MTIKYISFDLDDTFWDVMPTIYKAEEITTNWIKENYFGASKLMGTDRIIEIRNKLVNEDSSLKFQISKLRKKIFYETSLLAGYSTEESAEMSKRAFEIFIEARNDVVFFEGALEALKD
jgi:putative hydrolase of the HAD superfamily